MRTMFLTALAALALFGCVSTIEDGYDDHARAECDRETRAAERTQCYDRVEQNRREH